jgi:hypothetical protein
MLAPLLLAATVWIGEREVDLRHMRETQKFTLSSNFAL